LSTSRMAAEITGYGACHRNSPRLARAHPRKLFPCLSSLSCPNIVAEKSAVPHPAGGSLSQQSRLGHHQFAMKGRGVITICAGVEGEARVTFPYDAKAVATVKSVGGGPWCPEGKYWSFAGSEEALNRLISAFSGEELQIDPCLQPSSPDDLIERARKLIRTKHYSLRTEKSYLPWISRYAQYHSNRDPREMGAQEIEAFLSAGLLLPYIDNM
jgi:hypothetical protein